MTPSIAATPISSPLFVRFQRGSSMTPTRGALSVFRTAHLPAMWRCRRSGERPIMLRVETGTHRRREDGA